MSDPLPESAIPEDPCDAFTREQVEYALGDDAPEGERGDVATGPACAWQDTDSGAGFKAFFGTVGGEGLSSYYQNTQPASEEWEELPPIHGFPAVAFQITADGMNCQVVAGLADEYTVAVAANPSRAKIGELDPCDLAQEMAELLVENLKERAGR